MSLRVVLCRHAKVFLPQPLRSIILKKFSNILSNLCTCKIFCTCIRKLFNWIVLHISYYDWTENLHLKHINTSFQDKYLNLSYLLKGLQVTVVEFTNSMLWDWCNKFAELYYKQQQENVEVKCNFCDSVLIKIKYLDYSIQFHEYWENV